MAQLDSLWQKLVQNGKSRRVLWGLGVVGVLLLVLPAYWPEAEPDLAEAAITQDTDVLRGELEARLEQLVTAVTGEPSPVVLLTLEDDGSTQYAQNEQVSDSARENEHVLVKAKDGGQNALVVSQGTPRVQGVVIVSRYADNPAVAEKLTKAAQTAFSISSNRVCVIAGAGS